MAWFRAGDMALPEPVLITIHDAIWRYLVPMHYCAVIMGAMTSQITSLTIVYSTIHWGAYQRKYQSSASLASVRGIHRWPVNSPHKWPVTRKMFPFDDVIMDVIPKWQWRPVKSQLSFGLSWYKLTNNTSSNMLVGIIFCKTTIHAAFWNGYRQIVIDLVFEQLWLCVRTIKSDIDEFNHAFVQHFIQIQHFY